MSKDPIEKAIDKSLDTTVNGIAKFFGSICMPAAEELGELLKDQVKYYRSVNLLSIQEKIEKRIGKLPENAGSTSPKLLKALIEDASWEEDDTVQKLWAGLVAGEISSGCSSDDSVIYTEHLKSMSAYEARLLELIYSDDRVADLVFNSENSGTEFVSINPIDVSVVDILDTSPKPLDYIMQNHTHQIILDDEKSHMLAFGFVKPQLHSLVKRGLINGWEATTYFDERKYIRFEPSSLGLDLYMRCTGYKVYPLEAYVVTRKHWRDELGYKSNKTRKRIK